MKICYAANSRFPCERAHMTQIVAMCNAFVACGHEVTLLITNRKTHITEDPSLFYGVPISFKVVRVSVPDIAGISPFIPPLLRPLAFSLQRVVYTLASARIVRQQQFDCLYGRDEWILWIASLFVRTPIVWESHEARYSCAARKLIAKRTKLVCISEGIRDFYAHHGVTHERILVAHDAVDERFFLPHISQVEARQALSMSPKKPVVMYVGGLEAWKGVETLLEASEEQDEFETYIIGGKEKEIELLRAKYPSVHFLGPRPYRELPHMQQAADILVIPNTAKDLVSEQYTSPLKLFTYMTSKKPIVASRIPSITAVLSDCDAFFFTPDDPQNLRSVLLVAIRNRGEAMKKAQSAYKKSSEYTWERRASHIVTCIAQS